MDKKKTARHRINHLESRVTQLEQIVALTTGCFGLYVVAIYYVYYSISKI
jgi:hypothetical protein